MIAIVIPALNESVTIKEVVKDALLFGSVIVVDDGSSDNTTDMAESSGAIVVKHTKNMGKGVALKTGIMKAMELKPDIIVTMDADGQHDPFDIGYLTDQLVYDDADFVIGSRYIRPEYETPFYRRVGQKILDCATCPSGEVTDSQSGFRAFKASCVDVFRFKSTGMGIESEMLRDAIKAGKRVTETRITVRYDGLDCSTLPPFKHGLEVLSSLLTA